MVIKTPELQCGRSVLLVGCVVLLLMQPLPSKAFHQPLFTHPRVKPTSAQTTTTALPLFPSNGKHSNNIPPHIRNNMHHVSSSSSSSSTSLHVSQSSKGNNSNTGNGNNGKSTSRFNKAAQVHTTRPQTRVKPIILTHERDFFRQTVRLESMDSYLLVSTLTASMSYGALLGFTPSPTTVAAISTMKQTKSILLFGLIRLNNVKFLYNNLCLAIQVLAGLSTLFGLYATVVFSLTTLYGKAALGVERDREYDLFIRKTVRARVHGFRCYLYSLGCFAIQAFLVLVEKSCLHVKQQPIAGIGGKVASSSSPLVFKKRSLIIAFGAIVLLFNLFKDSKLLMESAIIIKKRD